MVKVILNRLKSAMINISVGILNLFIHRDKKILLFGAWMGSKFADNSRFWFQYLHENKCKYGIKKLIWVTRNEKVYTEMLEMGYEVYMMKSFKSLYWHLKAGVHVVCNMYAQTGKYPGDILGELSIGAIKIQLWHGVGIKASAKTTNDSKNYERSMSIKRRILRYINGLYVYSHFVLYPGGWDRAYYLTTSPENTRVMKACYGIYDKLVIESNYPREINDFILMKKEIEVINTLRGKFRHVILYLPTFRDGRDSYSNYVHPLSMPGLLEYLACNNCVWIEKEHSASTYNETNNYSSNVYKLESDFDINTIYQYVNLLITDYSSASSDCVFRWVKTLYFVPDFEEFKNKDRGFVSEYEKYCPGYIVKKPDELVQYIDKAFNENFFDEQMTKRYKETIRLLFDNKKCDLDNISRDIFTSIGVWEKS
ncbi:CDP-glycerol glycerophosphotransferase family protein [Haloimpatiens sp. FM7315]|uniref:CDP-glycerol glycerophosphotransferase family protein n=1 Tax=Haloimpatiens sp. FM7315 TaxID=3298609 RepID=UPI0039772C64